MPAIIASEISLAPDWTVFIQLVIFLSAMTILWFFVFKPTLKIIDYRKKFTKEAFDNANRLSGEALALDEKRKLKIAEVFSQGNFQASLKTSAKKQAADKIISGARLEAKKILDSTEESVEISEERVSHDISQQTEMLAQEVVKNIIPSKEVVS